MENHLRVTASSLHRARARSQCIARYDLPGQAMNRNNIGALATIAAVGYLFWRIAPPQTSDDYFAFIVSAAFIGSLTWGVISIFLPDTAAEREHKQKIDAYWQRREEETQREERAKAQQLEENRRKSEKRERDRGEADRKRKEQIKIPKLDPRIAKLEAFLAPNSGATANEREIARQKIKEIEEGGGGVYADVYTMGELNAEFTVSGFSNIISASRDRSVWTSLAIVRRKSDGQRGSMEHQDRLFFNFKLGSWRTKHFYGPECDDECRRSGYMLDSSHNRLAPKRYQFHWCRR
jgi:hypothetical protein